MRRLTRTVVGAVVVLAASTAVVAQQPTAGGTPGGEYYPLKVGNKWVYKVGDATTIEMKVEKIDAGEATLNTYVNGKQVASEAVKVQADGILRTKINGTEIKPAVKFLALPVKKGDKWKVDSKITVTGQEHAIKGEFTTKEDKEKIKVKDKDYETVVVDGPEFDIAGTKTAVKYWFAPNKGVVKLSYSIGGNDAVLELKEYVEGK
jgi:hypothetical protein